LLAAVTAGTGAQEEPIPAVVEARSAIGDFPVSVTRPGTNRDEAQTLVALEWKATRPATTTVYAIWLMVLMWGLSVTGLLIVWAVVIWRVELPFWVFGYFVGVLFALPLVRASLPGQPTPGTIFDFLSFYWSITIVGTTLILLLVIWIRRARAAVQLRDLDNGRNITSSPE
jgi:hypothetical protein